MKNDLSILIVTTDSYSDLWSNFFKCKEKYWSNCPYPTYLVTNDLKPSIPNVSIINCGENAQWSQRTRTALEAISSKYVIFLLEDYYITNFVNNSIFDETINFIKNNKVKYYKILNLTKFQTQTVKNKPYLYKIPAYYPYGISLTPSIWEKNYFLKLIGEGNYNPWMFEAERLKEEENAKDKNEILGFYDSRNIMCLTHLVVQGKYLPNSLKKILNLGIKVDLSKRAQMDNITYLNYNIRKLLSQIKKRSKLMRFILNPFKRYSISQRHI